MKKKKIDFTAIIIIFLLTLSYFSYSKINFYFQILAEIAIIGIAISKCIFNKDYNIEKKWINFIIMALIPIIILFIYSICIFLVENQKISYITGAFSTIIYKVIFILTAVSLVYLFKEKSVKIVTASAILNYLTAIITFIYNYGIGQLIPAIYNSIFDVQAQNMGLEAHEVTFVLGLLFLFYILKDAKKNKILLIILAFFMLAGFKRIQPVAIILGIITYFLLSKIKRKRIWMFIISITMLIISFIWIYLIKSNLLSVIGDEYGINFMSRLEFYNAIDSEYELSMDFLGRGVGFTSEWMSENIYDMGIHSDILRMYIEEGMYVYIYIFLYYIYLNSKRLYRNENPKNALVFFALMVVSYICWFTDNVEGYQNYNLVLYTIYFYLFFENDNKQIKERKMDINGK